MFLLHFFFNFLHLTQLVNLSKSICGVVEREMLGFLIRNFVTKFSDPSTVDGMVIIDDISLVMLCVDSADIVSRCCVLEKGGKCTVDFHSLKILEPHQKIYCGLRLSDKNNVAQ